MTSVKKTLQVLGLVLVMSLVSNISSNAQSPADDPGIGGPGAPGSSPAGDGSPIVPFDGGMSLMLAASGIAYGMKKVKAISCKL